MYTWTNSDTRLVFDLISKSIFRHNSSWVKFRFIVQVVHNRDDISDIKYFYVVLVGWDYYSDISFVCFYEIVFLQSKLVLADYCLSKIHFKIVFVYFYWVLIVCPNLCVWSFYLDDDACFSFLWTWNYFHSLWYFESFRNVINWLFYYLPKHLFVFALQNSCILLDF